MPTTTPPPAVPPPYDTAGDWLLVVPAKRLTGAKSRLKLPASIRQDLALAMTCDTVAAALGCRDVAAVWVVTADDRIGTAVHELGGIVVAEPVSGGPVAEQDLPAGPTDPADRPDGGPADARLNAAISYGVRTAAAGGWRRIAVLVADLPALRPAELSEALLRTRPAGLLVEDAAGLGTTLLCLPEPVRQGVLHFGAGSAAAHRAAGIPPLAPDVAAGLPGLRCDVDTLAALQTALRLGAGPRTAAAAGLANVAQPARPQPPRPPAG